MSRFKVGDKVRVLRGGSDAHYWCSHSAGDVCTVECVLDVCTVECVLAGGDYEVDYQIMHTDDIELIPTPRFKVGETYQTRAHGDNYKCINVNEDGSAHLSFDAHTPAYVWDADGRSVSFGSDWDVVFPPVVSTHYHKVYAHGEERETRYNLVDGKVDWSSLEILPCA